MMVFNSLKIQMEELFRKRFMGNYKRANGIYDMKLESLIFNLFRNSFDFNVPRIFFVKCGKNFGFWY